MNALRIRWCPAIRGDQRITQVDDEVTLIDCPPPTCDAVEKCGCPNVNRYDESAFVLLDQSCRVEEVRAAGDVSIVSRTTLAVFGLLDSQDLRAVGNGVRAAVAMEGQNQADDRGPVAAVQVNVNQVAVVREVVVRSRQEAKDVLAG
jgi:hypothetical protein